MRMRATPALTLKPLLGLVVVALVLATSARAESMAVPAQMQVPILMKVLAYDRQFDTKAGTALTIGIIYTASDPSSAKATDQISDTLYGFAGKTVRKVPVKYFQIEYTNVADLEAFVKAKGVNVFYLAPGNDKALPAILKLSQARGITTLTGVPDYVKRGVSVGVGLSQDKPQILINLTSARSEGSEFDANLLRIAIVVGK